jgi:UDP:flavonoid glycosyltransferase YjiC (YdhE family)
MRILLCTGDGGGNVPALVSVASELVRREHTVRVLEGPYYPSAPHSETLGAAFFTAGCEMVNREPAVWVEGAGPMPDLLSIPEHLQMLRTMALWMPVSVPWAVETAREIESFRPDVVLSDLILPGSAIAAEAAGVPCVVVLTTVPVHRLLPGLPVPGRGAPMVEDGPDQQEEFMKVADEVALPWLNAARTRLGLGPDIDPWAWEDRCRRVLILSSPKFDYAADSYPSNLVYTGSIRPSKSGGEWDNPWDPTDERPVVVVSTTTTGLAGLWFAVFRAAADALVELGMRGLFTVGPLDPNTLPQHESLVYRSFVPHSAVLPAASAMVSQCGHGATMAALRDGVPLVCVPVFADQNDIAARVVHHGAGTRLTTMSSPEEFRRAIEATVRDRRYRDAARALSKELASEDGARCAAEEVEAAATQ